MSSPTITLQADTEETVKIAAQFVAELVRQGIQFDGTYEHVRHVSGLHSVPGLELHLHGF